MSDTPEPSDQKPPLEQVEYPLTPEPLPGVGLPVYTPQAPLFPSPTRALSTAFAEQPKAEAKAELPPEPARPFGGRATPEPEPKAKSKALFSLDELDTEDPKAEPFVFDFAGETFELMDPKEVDWQDLMVGQDNPRLMLHVIMPEEQRESFFSKKLSVRKLEALMKRYTTHFGLPQSPGEADGSARS